MAFTPFVSGDGPILQQLSAILKQNNPSLGVVAPTALFWGAIVSAQHVRATNEIYSRLTARGYDAVLQIPLWDRGSEWETNLGTLYSLESAGMTEAVDEKLLTRLRDDYAGLGEPDKPTGLAAVLLTIGGVAQFPDDAPGTVQGGNPSRAPCSTHHWSAGDYGMRW